MFAKCHPFSWSDTIAVNIRDLFTPLDILDSNGQVLDIRIFTIYIVQNVYISKMRIQYLIEEVNFFRMCLICIFFSRIPIIAKKQLSKCNILHIFFL